MTSIDQHPPPAQGQSQPGPPELDEAQVEALVAAHGDESKMTTVVQLPVSIWRLVAASVRYVSEGIAEEHRSHVAELTRAHRAISTAVALRVPDARGQTDFCDELADDPTSTSEQKINWLRACVAELRATLARLESPPAAPIRQATPGCRVHDHEEPWDANEIRSAYP